MWIVGGDRAKLIFTCIQNMCVLVYGVRYVVRIFLWLIPGHWALLIYLLKNQQCNKLRLNCDMIRANTHHYQYDVFCSLFPSPMNLKMFTWFFISNQINRNSMVVRMLFVVIHSLGQPMVYKIPNQNNIISTNRQW